MKILTENDLSLVNGLRNGRTSFAIQCLTEDVFNDALAHELEDFLNGAGIFSDIFNVEYLGFLTGQVKTDNINSIIPLINGFLTTLANAKRN